MFPLGPIRALKTLGELNQGLGVEGATFGGPLYPFLLPMAQRAAGRRGLLGQTFSSDPNGDFTSKAP